MKGKKGFQARLDNFINWMEKDGMLDRWARQAEIDGVKKNRRRLNKKIKEERESSLNVLTHRGNEKWQ